MNKEYVGFRLKNVLDFDDISAEVEPENGKKGNQSQETIGFDDKISEKLSL